MHTFSILKRVNLLILILLFFFCGEPINPFKDIDNVTLSVAIPPRTDSFLWGIGDSVPVNITMSYLNLVDSIRVSYGEGDTVPNNDTLLLIKSEQQKDTTLHLLHIFSTTGQKTVTVYAFLCDDETLLSDSDNVNIGIKPAIDTLIIADDAVAGLPYFLYVKASGSPVLKFSWYKNGSVLPQDTCDTLHFNPLLLSDSGSYHCIVTNSWGSTTTSTIHLTVAPRFSVTYDGNNATGGTAPIDSAFYKAGDMLTVLGNTGSLVKTGCTFAGWNTKADGTGTSYAGGDTFSMGSANVVLYAKWTTNPTYTVAYDGNGSTSGSVPVDANNYEAGATVTVKGNTGSLAKTGCTFSGWNTKADGTGTSYAGSDNFSMGSANVVLYAKWTTNPTYTVTYDGNGSTSGSVPVDANNYETGATVTVKGNTGSLAKTGCTFAGWNTKADGTGTSYAGGDIFTMGSADVVLYAKWTTNPTYTVTYAGNGSTSGSVPVDANNYEAGATVTVKGNTGSLAKTGCTFAGWNTKADGTGTGYAGGDTFTMGSADVVLYAKWTTNPTYTVTYAGNGSTSGSVPVDANNYETGANVTVKGNTGSLAKTGCTFAGWNTKADGTGTGYAGGDTFSMGAANVVLYAKWTTNPTYTVTYDGNGSTSGSVPVDANNYETGATVTVKGNTGSLAKTGCTFAGWNTKADGTGTGYAGGDTFSMGAANVVLYAKWTTNPTYTVTYDGNGSISGLVPVDANNYETGATVTVKGNTGSLAKTGYAFSGWNTKADGTGTSYGVGNTFAMGSNNVILYAMWTINQYTLSITYSTGGTATGGGTVNHGVPTAISATPDAGYEFVNWTVTSGTGVSIGDPNSVSTAVTLTAGNANVRANFQLKKYILTITNSAGGTTTGGDTVDHGTSTVITATPAAGYNFVKWTVASGAGVSITDTNSATTTVILTAGNATVHAQFQLKTYTLTVTYTTGGTATGGGTVSHGVAAAISASPGTGYDFVNWTITSGTGVSIDNASSASTTVTLTSGNATVQANFQLKTYTLTVTNTTGGTATGGGTVSHGVAAAINATPGTGYNFVNWTVTSGTGVSFDNASSASANATLTSGNATVCANFQLKTYTVTFNSRGGSSVSPEIVSHGSKATQPTSPTRLGYYFDGWYKDSTCINVWDFATETVTADVTLYAKWIIKDADGNIYTEVKIGTQTWMVENLKTTHYRDGSPIDNVTDNTEWIQLTTPAYCWYDNTINNKTKYGALYNWYTVDPNNTKSIAPQGWRVPTDADWTTLENYLIENGYNYDSTTIGNKIAKSMATKTDWSASTVTGAVGNTPSLNNRSGFMGFPGGDRSPDYGEFSGIGIGANWWCATERDGTNAWFRYLFNDDIRSIRLYCFKSAGHSVRLVRDY